MHVYEGGLDTCIIIVSIAIKYCDFKVKTDYTCTLYDSAISPL